MCLLVLFYKSPGPDGALLCIWAPHLAFPFIQQPGQGWAGLGRAGQGRAGLDLVPQWGVSDAQVTVSKTSRPGALPASSFSPGKLDGIQSKD